MRAVAEIEIVEDGGYALWGTYKGEIVFIHLTDLAKTKPIRDDQIPRVGEKIRAVIFKVVELGEKVPADVSKEGKYNVRYAASVALLEEDTGE